MHMVLIFTGLYMLISVISILVSVYLIAGLISPDINLNIEHKTRKHFRRKSSVLFLDPRSHIRQRNTRLVWVLILIDTAIPLTLYLLLPLLRAR
jgi:hypothetical protein